MLAHAYNERLVLRPTPVALHKLEPERPIKVSLTLTTVHFAEAS